jgi:two-component system, chemotaxis family, sensor kinase Cph1
VASERMSTKKYDSEFCGSLPIHQINLIQPYGALVVVEFASLKIVQLSENADRIFARPVASVINTSLGAYLSQESLQFVIDKTAFGKVDKIPAVWEIEGKSYMATIHRHEDLLLVEIDLEEYDEKMQTPFVNVYQEIKIAMALIQSSDSIAEVAKVTARELKRISGFHKVMIYQFDPDYNGVVIAEEMEEDMESYNGFTFPASDIPAPARMLYLKNPYRFIPSREYQAVKLFPVINPITQSFLDLSTCNLRAVPAVHIEYLRNMNVAASMSTRILAGNKLWGLIACHHLSPMSLSFGLRSVFELISNLLSAKISGLQLAHDHRVDSRVKEDYKNMIEQAYRTNDVFSAMTTGEPDLLRLFDAQGMAICRKGKVYRKGITPTEDEINEFVLWLHTRELKNVFCTDSISKLYDKAAGFKPEASGALVIPVDPDEDEYVILFRPEVLQVINWGGDPNERIRFGPDNRNYHPRHSFKLWQERVEGVSRSWRDEELSVAESLRSFIFEFNNKR